MPPSAELRTFSVTSMNGAKAATNSDAGAISTAVMPEGTSSSPKVMRLNGSAIASAPSRMARQGRARSSALAARASAPPLRRRITAYSTMPASTQRIHTITAGSKSSSAYLISRYEPPHTAARAASNPTCRGAIPASVAAPGPKRQ